MPPVVKDEWNLYAREESDTKSNGKEACRPQRDFVAHRMAL